MPHPHQSMLDEFRYAINHFVSTVPEEVKKEAEEVLTKLTDDLTADESSIKDAFHDIGIQEYPHRKAFQELTLSKGGDRLKDLVLEHVDESVRTVVKPHLDSGVSLEEMVASDFFEQQLDGKQRYQIEDGILVAKSKLGEELSDQVSVHGDEYKQALGKWQANAQAIDKKISDLLALAKDAPSEQRDEMVGKAKRFREGFLLTERDPVLEEVEKEIEYWKDSFAEEE